MLLASFIAPFFTQTAIPAPPATSGNGGNLQKRLSQRERKALRRKLCRSQNTSDKFLVEVQSRAKRPGNFSEWTVAPERIVGEITSWNQRSGFGFVKTDDFDSEILLYARDIGVVPEEYDTGQKKINWCGFHVEFEMKYENQARAINAKIMDGREAVEFFREGNEENSGATSSGDEWESRWTDSSPSSSSTQQQDVEDSPKRKSGVKIKSTRSRRSLAWNAEMDLKEWQDETARPRTFEKDYDDFEAVKKRRKGHKLKLDREREQWKKTRKLKYFNKNPRRSTPTYRPRVAVVAPRPRPRFVAPGPKKWIAQKKDTYFANFYKMFERIASTSPGLQSREVVRLVVQKLYDKIIVSEGLKKHIRPKTCTEPLSECPVCFTEFVSNDHKDDDSDDDEEEGCAMKTDAVTPPSLSNCGHASLCSTCLQRYMSVKIDGDDVLPWITCPAEKCRSPILFCDIATESVCGVTTAQLYRFCLVILQKQLSRSPQFVRCSREMDDGKPCNFGFFCDKPTTVRRTCKCCGLVQDIKPQSPEDFLDDGFKALLRSGHLRLCPSCSHPAMKDYGMCNVMECGKCGIFWNWRTSDTGSTYNKVKENGRRNGSLWEGGELQYQLNLQTKDPLAFKALLERNGIKYNPNFVRGRS